MAISQERGFEYISIKEVDQIFTVVIGKVVKSYETFATFGLTYCFPQIAQAHHTKIYSSYFLTLLFELPL